MSIIRITVSDQDLVCTSKPVIASQGVEEDSVAFLFSSEWDGMGKVATFFNIANKDEVYTSVVDAEGVAVVPWEVTQTEGAFYIGVYGVSGDTIYTSNLLRYTLGKGIYTIGQESEPPTPDIIAQLLSYAGGALAAVADETAARITADAELSNRIGAVNSRVDETVSVFGVDSVETTLYTGVARYSGTSYTLAEDASVYTYLDLYINAYGKRSIRTIPVSASRYDVVALNLADYVSGQTTGQNPLIEGAEFQVSVSGTTFTIDNHTYYRNNSAVAGDPVAGQAADAPTSDLTNVAGWIEKIVGRKVAGNTELADIRVGADGTTYDTAGTAVRTQIDEVDDGLNFVDGQIDTILLSSSDPGIINCVVTDTNTLARSAGRYKSYQIARNQFWKILTVTAGSYNAVVTFVNTALPTTPTSGADMTDALAYGETGRHVIAAGATEEFTIPYDTAYIVITYLSWSVDWTPSLVTASGILTSKVEKLTPQVEAWTAYSDSIDSEKLVIPDYYHANDYLTNKIDAINAKRDEMSANSDSFFFITDHHWQYNEGRSPALIKYIAERTGITKLINGGDNGGASPSAYQYRAARLTEEAISKIGDSVRDQYCILGNHEWNDGSVYSTAGAIAYYLEKYKAESGAMSPDYGSYWIDNPVNKIRYFFLQDNVASYPLTGSVEFPNATIDWFANELMNVPDGYSVMVSIHYAYVPPADSAAEYDGFEPTYGRRSIGDVSRVLAAFRDKALFTFTVSDPAVTVTYDFRNISGTHHVIGVFSGHLHHGFLYTESQTSGIEDIAVFVGSTDSLHATSIGVNGHPWFWEDGIVGGTKVERTAGTVLEQCFYVVQIDLDAKEIYIHAVGGDHDWSGTYEP